MDKKELIWSKEEMSMLKEKILKRVNFAWFMKRVALPLSSASLISGAVLLYAIKMQHVAMIYKNISERLSSMDVIGLSRYFFVAVQKTELDTLLMLTSGSLLLAYFSRRLIQETINYWTGGVVDTFATKRVR